MAFILGSMAEMHHGFSLVQSMLTGALNSTHVKDKSRLPYLHHGTWTLSGTSCLIGPLWPRGVQRPVTECRNKSMALVSQSESSGRVKYPTLGDTACPTLRKPTSTHCISTPEEETATEAKPTGLNSLREHQ